MSQPYMDLPFAASDATYALSFFQQQYNVLDNDIIDLMNATVAGCEKKYEKLIQTLRQKEEKILVFHIFTGHGVLVEGQMSILINQYDEDTNFYARF